MAKKRLFNLRIKEISLVDSPAIGEEFIIVKSVNGKGNESMTTKKKGEVVITKAVTTAIIQKGAGWGLAVEKSTGGTDEEKAKRIASTHCNFCKITAEEEAKSIGMGLLCNCCFVCALERMEKGVFDACCEGTFNFEEYQKSNPEEFATKTEPVTEPVTEPAKVEPTELEKRLQKVEKSTDDVQTMLTAMLDMHDQAAGYLNAIVQMTVDALNLCMSIDAEQNGVTETRSQQFAAVTALLAKTREVDNTNVQKAGAKVSRQRLALLQEIADKLSALISEVLPPKKPEDGAAGGCVAGMKGALKSASQDIETFKSKMADFEKAVSKSGTDETAIADLKKSVEEAVSKVGELTNRLNDVEKGAGASSSITDDDDSEDEDASNGGGESVFKGFGPLSDVTKRIQKTNRVSNVKAPNKR